MDSGYRNPERKEEKWKRLHELTGRQHGVITLDELLSIGFSAPSIARAVQAGKLENVHRRVYAVPGVPWTWIRRQAAAQAWAGETSLASHRAAATLFDLSGVPRPAFTEIARVDGSNKCPKGIVVHRAGAIPPADLTRRHDLRVTDPTRTLIDLGAVVDPLVVELALEDALRRGLTAIPRLHRRLEDVGRQGRRGAGVLRAILANRTQGAAPTESDFETIVERILKHEGLPPPVRQFPLSAQGVNIRADFAYPWAKVAVEAVSRRFDAGSEDHERNVRKRNVYRWLDWRVVWVTWEMAKAPSRVRADVRAELFPPLNEAP